jgi:hypothetical protein
VQPARQHDGDAYVLVLPDPLLVIPHDLEADHESPTGLGSSLAPARDATSHLGRESGELGPT